MRKRVDVQAEEAARESRSVDAPPPPLGGSSPKLLMEDQFSEMCIELQKRGYGLVRLTNVAEWLPQVRHVVAMWLAGQISESDVPEAVRRFRGEKVDEHPFAKPSEPLKNDASTPKNDARRRDSDDAESMRKTALSVEDQRKSLSDRQDGNVVRDPSKRVQEDAPHFRLESVTVTWGEEKYTPVPYQTFSVGPFTAMIAVGPGESPETVVERGYAVLDAFAKKVREKKLEDYVTEIARQRKKLGAEARS